MEFNSEYIEAIEGFQKIKEGLAEVVASKARVAVTSLSSAFSAQIQNVLKETWNLTKFMNPLAEALKALYNPESLFSYEKYKNALNGYHWTLPYDMKAENLNELLSTVDSEVAFDKYMIKYFSKDKTDATFTYILDNLPRKHRTIMKQIRTGYENKQYALINLAMMSVIDDILSSVLVNAGANTNSGILQPIVLFLEKLPFRYFDVTCFEVLMLNNNINFIFENQNFSDGYMVSSNKKARRHSAMHGRSVSNKKIDSLMLINTIQTILSVKKILDVFRRTIIRDKKEKLYVIDSKKEKLVNKRFEKLIIDATTD